MSDKFAGCKKHKYAVSKIIYKILLKTLHLYTHLNGKRVIVTSDCKRPIKANLGCGLKVAKGWINVDYNMTSLFSRLSHKNLGRLYRVLSNIGYSELNRPFRLSLDEDAFVNILSSNRFFCRDLLKGIPFVDESVEYYYSSHMIGFSFSGDESEFVLREVYRTLRKGGIIRLSLVDGDYYWLSKVRSEGFPRRFSNDNCYTYDEICFLLKDIGYTSVERLEFCSGRIPDIDCLDDYSPEVDNMEKSRTLYIEAEK